MWFEIEPERNVMDYISSFDIRLSKEVYYAGETVEGSVLLENSENCKIKGIRVLLRGKVHATLKVVKSGERRTVKDDQYVLDDKEVIWGQDKHTECDSVPILPRGVHNLPFCFDLPQTALPCSLESRYGTIRYYIKVIIDIPYASSPQGIKYFTVIGPHIDCMEQKFISPLTGQDKLTKCCWCCRRGALALRVTLDRTAYMCGENIRVRAQVENRRPCQQAISIKLIQHVEYFIEKGVLGESKSLSSTVFHQKSPSIAAYSQGKYDSTLEQPISLPVIPPTLVGVCRLVQIYYILKVCLEDEKGNEALALDFPFTVATSPFRVYDGEDGEQKEEEIILYRPVYAKVIDRRLGKNGYSISPAATTTGFCTPRASRGDLRGNSNRTAGSMQSIGDNGGLRRCSGGATPTFISERHCSQSQENLTAVLLDKSIAMTDRKEDSGKDNSNIKIPLVNGTDPSEKS